MDTENLVLAVFSALDEFCFVGVDALIDPWADVGIRPYRLQFDIFRAFTKICGVLRFRGERSAAQQRVDVGFELNFKMIFIDENLVNQQLQVVPLQLVLFQNVAEHVDGGLGHAVHLNNGVALVAQQVDLVVDAVDFLLEVSFHLVIQRLDGGFLLRLFHNLPDALALRDLQFFGEIGQHRRQIVGRLFRFRHLLGLSL